MKFWKTALAIVGALLISFGIILFICLLGLNDPEIEGESGRISLGTYFTTLIPITIGILLFLISLKIKESN
jgi:hypothetical protein